MASRQFFGTHDNKLDAKNRVSIPAGFRAVMRTIEAEKLILRPSLSLPAIEAWPDVYFAAFQENLKTKDVFSEDHYNTSWDTYSLATETEPDRDGRVILGADLIAGAGLSGEVAVIGLGNRFEIWDRAAAKARAAARIAARQAQRLTRTDQA